MTMMTEMNRLLQLCMSPLSSSSSSTPEPISRGTYHLGLLLEQESPERVAVLVVVVYQRDKPPLARDVFEQLPCGRQARVEEGPLCPDVKRFFLLVSSSASCLAGQAHLPRQEGRLLDDRTLHNLLTRENTPRDGIDRIAHCVREELARPVRSVQADGRVIRRGDLRPDPLHIALRHKKLDKGFLKDVAASRAPSVDLIFRVRSIHSGLRPNGPIPLVIDGEKLGQDRSGLWGEGEVAEGGRGCSRVLVQVPREECGDVVVRQRGPPLLQRLCRLESASR